MRAVRRLYEDDIARLAARRLTGEMLGEFSAHPAVMGWIVGDGMMSTTPPDSSEGVEEWLEIVIGGLSHHGKGLWHGVSALDVAIRRAFSPGGLASHGVAACVRLDWMPRWAGDRLAWASFLARYVRMLRGLAPLLVDTAAYPILSPSMSESRLDEVVAAVREAGAGGLEWPALFNYDPGLRTREPFLGASGEMTRGLFTSFGQFDQGSEAWLEGVAQPGRVTPGPTEVLDEEVRARDAESFIRSAYREFGE
jgi:hypothetical protein